MELAAMLNSIPCSLAFDREDRISIIHLIAQVCESLIIAVNCNGELYQKYIDDQAIVVLIPHIPVVLCLKNGAF